jgi:acyl-CoA thioesterase
MADSEKIAAAVARFITENDQFARHLGIELIELRPGYAKAAMTIGPHMVNGLGMPHGAAIFALADFAFAAAGNSHGRAAVALSMDIHFVRSPRPGARLTVEASEARVGYRTGLYRMSVTAEDGELVAELHGMAYRKEERFLDEKRET